MKKFGLMICLCASLLMMMFSVARAETITFTAGDVEEVMSYWGAPLHDSTNQWGLWAVRAMPIVEGSGIYTITGGSTTQTGWGVDAPSWYSWNAPYGMNSAWFWDESGAEVSGNPPNPLYMIMDQPADTFTSYYGNTVTAVNESSTFTFNFTLGPGATWDGRWQFVVDGSKYTLGTQATPGTWVENFFGGYGSGGGLGGALYTNLGPGYPAPVPEPTTMLLLGFGLLGLAGYGRKKFFKK